MFDQSRSGINKIICFCFNYYNFQEMVVVFQDEIIEVSWFHSWLNSNWQGAPQCPTHCIGIQYISDKPSQGAALVTQFSVFFIMQKRSHIYLTISYYSENSSCSLCSVVHRSLLANWNVALVSTYLTIIIPFIQELLPLFFSMYFSMYN